MWATGSGERWLTAAVGGGKWRLREESQKKRRQKTNMQGKNMAAGCFIRGLRQWSEVGDGGGNAEAVGTGGW